MAKVSDIKVIAQGDKFKLYNCDNLTVDAINKDNSKHGSLFSNSIRCIISGSSGCGKTNVLLNLLTNINGLKFLNVYIFSKSLNQAKYKLLEKILSDVPQIQLFKFDVNDEILEPNQALEFSVFIFDDVAMENQNKIRQYFSMGRHHNLDILYLGQSFSKIPKQLIRDNANLLVLFKQDDTNLKHIYSEHVGNDMSFEEFKNLCYDKAWTKKYDFLVIDKERSLNEGRYRIGFDKFIIFQ